MTSTPDLAVTMMVRTFSGRLLKTFQGDNAWNIAEGSLGAQILVSFCLIYPRNDMQPFNLP